MYLSEGLAHGFLALQDNSTVMYLCSAEYSPQREHTIAAPIRHWDRLADWSTGRAPQLSDRDAAAPSPRPKSKAAGLLPSWAETQAFVAQLRDV